MKPDLKEIIKSWQFASCPVEQKGIFWRWHKEELGLLAGYIQELMEEARSEKNKDKKDLATEMFEAMRVNVVDVSPIKKDKK